MKVRRGTAANALWLMAGRITNKLLVFVTGVLLARYLGSEQYGLLSYAGAYLTFFSAVCGLGLDTVTVKALVDRPEEEGCTVGTALALRGIAAVLAALVMTGAAAIADRQEPLTVAVTALYSLSLLPQSFEVLKRWFQRRLESKYAALAASLGCAASAVWKLALMILGADLGWFALATAVEYAVMGLLLLGAYRKRGGRPLRFSGQTAKYLLRSGRGFLLSGIMVSVYASTDKLMLGRLLDKDAVACYSLAVSLCAVWGFVLEAVIESAQPEILTLYGRDREGWKEQNRRLYRLVFYGALAMSLVTCLVAEPLVLLLYGGAYAGAVAPLRIVVWYTAFSYLGGARNAWILCENAQGQLKYLYTAAAILNAGLNILLIPVWGASGAAVASLATQIASSLVIPLVIPALRPNGTLMLEAIFFCKKGKNGEIMLDKEDSL